MTTESGERPNLPLIENEVIHQLEFAISTGSVEDLVGVAIQIGKKHGEEMLLNAAIQIAAGSLEESSRDLVIKATELAKDVDELTIGFDEENAQPSKRLSEERSEEGEKLASEFIDDYLTPASRNLTKIGKEFGLRDVLFVLYKDFVEEKQVENVFRRSDIAFVLQTRATALDNKKVSDVASLEEVAEHVRQILVISYLKEQVRDWLDVKAMIEEGSKAWNTPAPGQGELKGLKEKIDKIEENVKENRGKGWVRFQERVNNQDDLMRRLGIEYDDELVKRLIS